MARVFFLLLLMFCLQSHASAESIANTALKGPVITTDASYAPFESVDPSGKLIGFEVDIVTSACQKMKVNCKIVNLPGEFPNLLTNLKAEKYDATFGAFGITTERQKDFLFSNPYYQTSTSLIGSNVRDFALENHVITDDYQNKNVMFVWTGNPLLNLVIGVKTDMSEIFEDINKLRYYTLASAITIMLLVLAAAIYLATSITEPILKLTSSVQEETNTDQLLTDIDPKLLSARDEIGVLTRAFREKSEKIQNYLKQLHSAQEQMIQSEKMAALGNLVAGVAHEINTPLGAINATVSNMDNAINELLNQMPAVIKELPENLSPIFFDLLSQSLKSKAEERHLNFHEKRKYKREIIEYLEKNNIDMADYVGDMFIDMGIYENIDKFLPLLQAKNSMIFSKVIYDFSLLKTSKNNIENAVKLVSKVVFALKYYSHAEYETKKTKGDVVDSIEVILTLYHNQFKRGIIVEKNYEKVPKIEGYFDELNQVWNNIIYNAIQAMHNKGTLIIGIYQKDQNIHVEFTDDGPGIKPEVMPHIFEPFFTTKPAGEGSGLGLSIVKRIIDKHKGKIEVNSVPGKTTFCIILPMQEE